MLCKVSWNSKSNTPEVIFTWFIGLQAWNFAEKELRHILFPRDFMNFPENIISILKHLWSPSKKAILFPTYKKRHLNQYEVKYFRFLQATWFEIPWFFLACAFIF